MKHSARDEAECADHCIQQSEGKEQRLYQILMLLAIHGSTIPPGLAAAFLDEERRYRRCRRTLLDVD